ncbi:DNA methyltransferase, partial [Candidatus Avelusimicrobium stercoris]|uniref:site-specific DNA-methyltransferase n=1 Tax=Candidatus Avelusimicrobium stercoris TaxID=1947924 RepID=UPI003D132948
THNSQPENKDSQNLFFSGDNLEVLKHLQNAYANSIDMIYIDPPYNTGSDGFLYNDKFEFTDEQLMDKLGLTADEIKRLHSINGRSSHSAWLTFMYPRLKIAKKLLKDSGVIFISIDDNEQANLKLLCDEIFSERNLITTLVWHNNVKGRQLDKFIKNTYEYVLLYAKNSINLTFNLEKYTLDKKEVFQDNISFYSKGYPLHNGTADFHISNRPNLAYSIYYNPTTKDAFTKDEKVIKNGQIIIGPATERREGYVRIIPKYNHKYNNQRVWRWGQEKFLKEYKTELIFVEEADGYYIYGKDRYEGNYGFKSYKNYINIDSGNGKQELVELELGRIFDNPKTIKLIYHLLKIAIQEQSIILDFFSGSATTAHAVMKLNAEDGGNRKYIMVQLPEECDKTSEAYKAGYKTIDQIGMERIKRAAKQLGDTSGFKHYYVKEPTTQTLDKILAFDPNKSLLLADDMVAEMGGQEVILDTWLVADGYKLTNQPKEIDIAGYKAYYLDNSLLYIINVGWSKEQTRELLNLVGTNQLSINTIICYGYSFTMESMKELEINVKQSLNRQVRVEKRF